MKHPHAVHRRRSSSGTLLALVASGLLVSAGPRAELQQGPAATPQQPAAAEVPSPPISTVARTLAPRGPSGAGTGAVRAVLVRGWLDSSASAWQELNDEWPQYGTTPIEVDTTTLGAVISFTYEDLVASGADVIVLSDPAGGLEQFSEEEIAAIRDYALEGHGLVGTYVTFSLAHIDNTSLAPIFGLALKRFTNHHVELSNEFAAITDDKLFLGLPNTQWIAEGHPFTQSYVRSSTWDDIPLPGARIVAECDDFRAVITVYDAPTYSAVYFSYMPEHFGGTVDKQLLYNAITY